MYRWVTSASFFQRRERGVIDNPQTIEEKLKVAEAKLKIAEEKLAVVDLFIKARYEAGAWEFKGNQIKVQRGDVVTAQSALAQQWGWRTKSGWDAKRVARFLKDLEAEGWIKIKSTFKSHTIISILIYVPAAQAAKETGEEFAKNLPKNPDDTNPGNAGESGSNNDNSAKDSAKESAEILPISDKINKESNINTSKVDADDEKKTDDDCSVNDKKNETFLCLQEKSNQVISSYQKRSKSSVPKPAPAQMGTVIYEYYRNKLLKEYGIKHLKEAADGKAGKKIFENFADIEKAKEYVDYAFKDEWIKKMGYKFSCFMSHILLNNFEIFKKLPKQPIITSYDAFEAPTSTKKFQTRTKEITSYDDF